MLEPVFIKIKRNYSIKYDMFNIARVIYIDRCIVFHRVIYVTGYGTMNINEIIILSLFWRNNLTNCFT